MAQAKGVTPDPVVRDPRSSALLLFANLRPDVDLAAAQAFLGHLTELVTTLTAKVRDEPVARIAIGFGRSFFARYGLDAQMPSGLRTPPAVPTLFETDLGFYLLSRSDAATADFLSGLAATKALTGVTLERGYQRLDGRELAGFRDGLRNVRRDRRGEIVFVDTDRFPEEPDWAEDGTYLAYLKIPQNLEGFGALPVQVQEAIVGRRKADGSRLDLPEGTNARTEAEMTGDQPPVNSHVRKSGPRGPRHDEVQIFRRGVPFLTLREDGTLQGGLQFVSFQASLAYFDVVLNRWMTNPAFPTPNAGADRLFAEGFATIEKGAFFFVAPYRRGRPIGEGLFEPAKSRPTPHEGRVAVRKRLVDGNGNPSLGELSGFGFRLFDVNGQPACDDFFTNPAGHALSALVPTGVPFTLRETTVPAGIQPAGDQAVTLTRRSQQVEVTNTVPTGSPYGT